MVFASIYLIGVGACIGAIAIIRRVFKKPNGRSRTMSFNSQAMIHGAFPPTAIVAQPIIDSILLFKVLPSEHEIVECFKPLLKYDRFRCTPVLQNGSWKFVDTDVDISKNHVSSIAVANEQEIPIVVDKLNAQDLPGYGNQPLWQVYRIVNEGQGMSAVLLRIHHVMGDGIGLMGVMTQMFKDENGETVTMDIPEKMRQSDGQKKGFSFKLLFELISSFFEVLLLQYSRFDSNIKFTAKDQAHITMEKARKTVYFPTLRLDFVKQIKNKAGVTINDVLLAGTAGALRRYSLHFGDPAITKPDVVNRVLMPVAFPRPKAEQANPSTALRNKWAFMSVPLPVGASAPRDSLAKCSAATTQLKKSPIAIVQLWVQSNLLQIMPLFMQRQTAFDSFVRHTMVFSNLPGPAKPMTFCGQKLEGLQLIFPNLIPQVIIISYAEEVFFNMTVDPTVVGQTDLLAGFFLDEMKAMAAEFGVDTHDSFVLSDKSPSGVFGLIKQ